MMSGSKRSLSSSYSLNDLTARLVNTATKDKWLQVKVEEKDKYEL